MVTRAGGWVDRGDGKGWMLDTPGPSPRPVAQTPLPADEKRECPDCGKQVVARKDGSLRKHTCVLDAPDPDVTFEQKTGEPDGDIGVAGR